LEGKDFELLVMAISGSAALLPLLKAIAAGKDIALANKEALVMAGPMIMAKAKQNHARIFPIDSEESAIWQCLEAEDKTKIKTIYLTASGGPFRDFSSKDLRGVSKKQVLRHPRWKMGKKVTVDSATLMNKGFEMLEATHLFGVAPKAIRVVIHPEAIIHSMVEFIDGVIMAQLSVTDMRIPIQYALAYPERIATSLRGLDFYKLKSLNFQEPDFRRFPCLGFAYRAAQEAGTAPCVLNAANEIGVEAFLNGGLDFIGIPRVIETVLAKHQSVKKPGLGDILAAQAWAREEAFRVIKKRGKA
jgi:1-deoxy-D-xylulose-5-phosphate reductoisomerase